GLPEGRWWPSRQPARAPGYIGTGEGISVSAWAASNLVALRSLTSRDRRPRPRCVQCTPAASWHCGGAPPEARARRHTEGPEVMACVSLAPWGRSWSGTAHGWSTWPSTLDARWVV